MTLARLRVRAATVAAVLIVVLASVAVQPVPAAAADPTPAMCAPDPVLCPPRIYVGAAVDGLPTSTRGLDDFAAATGRSPSLASSGPRMPNRTATLPVAGRPAAES